MDLTKLPDGPPPDLAAQFQRLLDLLYQKGNNLSDSERKRMETCYVVGAQLSLTVLTHAVNHPIDAVGHKIMETHRKDVEDSLARVGARK